MTENTDPWADAIDALKSLDCCLRDCPSKHDRVDLLIAAAIGLGIDTRETIVSAVMLCGYDGVHVLIRLAKNAGRDPIAKRWWHDGNGQYHNHPD